MDVGTRVHGGRDAAPVLRAVDARLARELPARRALRARLRAARSVAARLMVDASIIAGAATLVTQALAPAPAALSGAHRVVTLLLVTLVALAVGENAGVGRRLRAWLAPVVACGLLATVLPLLVDPPAAMPWTGWSGGLLLAAASAPLLLLRGRRYTARARGPRPERLRGALLLGSERDVRTARATLGDGGRHRLVDALTRGGGAPAGRAGIVAMVRRQLATREVSEVVVVSVMRALTLRAIAATCWAAGVRCLVMLDGRDVRVEPSAPLSLGDASAMELLPDRVELPTFGLKRAIDLVLGALLVIFAAPLALVIAVAIRVESRGPVFFRQRRVGLGGRQFTIWKFRSMHCADVPRRDDLSHLNHYGDAPLFKLANDPRTTRVGRLLRRTSLDELPQLLNVLRGEMSLVGPRPPLPEEVARYAPHHYVRLTVVPGMTGPWQVGGRNLIRDFEEIVRMEREYIDAWSLRRDLRILVRTVSVVVKGTGAY